MKRSLFCIITLMCLVGCSNKDYEIKGTFSNDTYNGEYIYLTLASNSNDVLDSALVENRAFVMKGRIDSIEICRLLASSINTLIVLEPGVTNVDFADQVSKIGGTRLNDSLNAINERNDSLYQLYRSQTYPIIQSNLSDSAKRVKIDSLAAPIQSQMINSLDASYASNANNVLGAYLFTTMAGNYAPDEVDALYQKGGATVQNHPLVKQVMKENETLKKTQPGQPFINFTIPDGTLNGGSTQLSDYVGKGYYTLVDFWASWCGPCMREVPTLKELYKTYGGEHFQILGVAVWDQRDNSMRAIKDLGMTWPQIVNAGTVPTELYGIKGIPQIMLFAPDGTIVARDLRGEEMVKLVGQEMAKYGFEKK